MRKPYQAKTIAKFLIEAAEAAEPTICMTNSNASVITLESLKAYFSE